MSKPLLIITLAVGLGTPDDLRSSEALVILFSIEGAYPRRLFITIITSIIAIGVITMIQHRTAMEVRNNLGEILNQVNYQHAQVIITKAGKPAAAIVEVDVLEKLEKVRQQFFAIWDELGESAKASDLTPGDIDAMVREIRGK